MEKNSTYRYFVKPLRANTNEAIAERLNALGEAAFSAEVQRIEVGYEVVEGVYRLPHQMLTELRRTEHYRFVRVFVQEGEGQIRPYWLFKRLTQKLSKTKAVKTVHKTLKTGKV